MLIFGDGIRGAGSKQPNENIAVAEGLQQRGDNWR